MLDRERARSESAFAFRTQDAAHALPPPHFHVIVLAATARSLPRFIRAASRPLLAIDGDADVYIFSSVRIHRTHAGRTTTPRYTTSLCAARFLARAYADLALWRSVPAALRV